MKYIIYAYTWTWYLKIFRNIYFNDRVPTNMSRQMCSNNPADFIYATKILKTVIIRKILFSKLMLPQKSDCVIEVKSPKYDQCFQFKHN